jgi:SAM-dependent methyltransferase
MVGIREFYETGIGGGEDADETEERITIVREWAAVVRGDVVDIGCSDGRLAARLRGPGRRVIGVDLNGAQLRLAAERLDDVKSFDITSAWPFEDGALAAIHMGAVIEHVFDFRGMFAEASRVLAPGGLLWISTPNMACLRHRVEMLLGRMPRWYMNYEHIRPWTVDWLDEQLAPGKLLRTRLRGAHVKVTPVHRMISRFLPTLSSIFVVEYRKS